MGSTPPRALDPHEREQMRQWLRQWRAVAPLLERDRITGIQSLTESDAARIACDLWLWARPGGGDDAAGLLSIKRVLIDLGDR
jgi:hypothetical protein